MKNTEHIKARLVRISILLVFLISCRYLNGQQDVNTSSGENGTNIVSLWSFENSKSDSAFDRAQNISDPLFGNFEYVDGIKGKGLKLDGFRTYAKRLNMLSDGINGSFTVEAWIAPACYPWSWCPVLDCSVDNIKGFFFGLGPEGQLAFKIAAGSRWYEAISETKVALGTWSHIAGVFSPDDMLSIFINGENVASLDISGSYVPSGNGSLSIGRNNSLQVWKEFQLTSQDTYFYLDAILDEICVTAKEKTSVDIKKHIASIGELPVPQLSKRGLFPKGQAGSGSFGAFYTKLDYYKEWDDMWRVSDKSDVFIRFEDSPVQLVFWRGASFVPCWVSENDIWYTNEWLETWGSDVVSCAEPIMDRYCKYSHVRIIENTDARVVVHWRYALSDAFYKIAAIGDDGRGEWCDEYHIIYPDNVGVRRMELHYSVPERKHDWLEQIVLTSPGDHPDDLIYRNAISLANMKGDVKDYTWDENLEIEMTEPEGANISLVNLKSEFKPFIIIPPGPVSTVEGKWDSPFFRTYAAHMASGYRPDPVPSVFGWWNHWPVAQVPGDGRWMIGNDRPGHFNLTTFVQWNDYDKTERTRTRIMLQGMTNLAADDLVPLAQSWLDAPELQISSKGYNGGRYEMAERAYLIQKISSSADILEVSLNGSNDSPVLNPAFIIKNWGKGKAEVKVNGEKLNNKDFRQGLILNPSGEDLVLWLKLESAKKLNIEISGIQ